MVHPLEGQSEGVELDQDVPKTATPDGRKASWATGWLKMTDDPGRSDGDGCCMEAYHLSLKEFTGVECSLFRTAVAQRNHIGLALRAFRRLEIARLVARGFLV